MHAYVADGFDAQTGVFSMFNPSVWPVVRSDDLRTRSDQALEEAGHARIGLRAGQTALRIRRELLDDRVDRHCPPRVGGHRVGLGGTHAASEIIAMPATR